MKSLLSVVRFLRARPLVRLVCILLVSGALLWVAIWLTPPIACNAAIEGSACEARTTTARHLAEIGLSGILTVLLVSQNAELSRSFEAEDSRVPGLIVRCAFAATLAGSAIYLVLAITRLVQAG